MHRSTFSVLATGVLLCTVAACGSVQSYPLIAPAAGPRAAFSSIAACAEERQHQVTEHDDSVNVEVEAGAWVQFMDRGSSLDMVIVGAVDSAQATRAKTEGDAIYSCAEARLAASSPAPGGGAKGPDLGGALGEIGEGIGASAWCTAIALLGPSPGRSC